jgi:hypothetical protein
MAVFVAASVAAVSGILLVLLVMSGRRVPAAVILVVSALPWIAGSVNALLQVAHAGVSLEGVRYDELAPTMARAFSEAMATRFLGAALGAAVLGAMVFGLALAARSIAKLDVKGERAITAGAVAVILALVCASAAVSAVAASFLEQSYLLIAEASPAGIADVVMARSMSAPLYVGLASITPVVVAVLALAVVGLVVARFGPTPRRVLGGALAVVIVAGLGYLDGAAGRAVVRLLDETHAVSWVARDDFQPIAFRGGAPVGGRPSALVREEGVVELGGDGEHLGQEAFTPVGRGQLVSLFRRLPGGAYSEHEHRSARAGLGGNLVLTFDARTPPEVIGAVIFAAEAADACSLTIFGRHPDGISEDDVAHLRQDVPMFALPLERAAVVTTLLGACHEEAGSEPGRPVAYLDVDTLTVAALADLRASNFAPFLVEISGGLGRFEGP